MSTPIAMHRIESRVCTVTAYTFGFAVLLAPGAARVGTSCTNDAGMTGPQVEVSVTTDKTEYARGEPVVVQLQVTNRTEEIVTFHFSDGQRYDFLIQDEGGETRWRWSADKSFIQVLGEEQLAPGDTLTYQERFEGPLSPGHVHRCGGARRNKFSPAGARSNHRPLSS